MLLLKSDYPYPLDELEAERVGGEKVFVYRNIRTKAYSAKSKTSGLVIFRAPGLFLKDCTFKVSEAGRQRVLREKRKNVHAGIEGTLTFNRDFTQIDACYGVYYNPYKGPNFLTSDGTPALTAAYVWLSPIGVWAYGINGEPFPV